MRPTSWQGRPTRHVTSRTACGGAVAAIILLAGGGMAAAVPALRSEPAVKRPSVDVVPVQAPAPKATPKAQSAPAAQPKPKEDTAAARPGDAQLRQRVEQLEEQLADMQVQMGTLESLGKGGGGVAASAAVRPGGNSGGVDQARIDSLDIQLRALAAQVEQMSVQLRQAGRRSDAGPPPEPAPRAELPATRPAGSQVSQPASSGGFGSLTVTPGAEGDPIGRLITDPAAASGHPLPPGAANAGSPKELYETAYGYLLQQDYGAAEVAFEEFLRRYPSDRQSADAQYWYAETLYVQRRYKPAGQAFLKVIEKHQASSKVPNSLLKLALTLEQLGQKDCGLFNELDTRHPNAPADVKTKSRALRQRVGC